MVLTIGIINQFEWGGDASEDKRQKKEKKNRKKELAFKDAADRNH